MQIAQLPLSQQIRQLERTLGGQLFERNYHTVTLTAAGQVFLEETQRVLEQYAFDRPGDVRVICKIQPDVVHYQAAPREVQTFRQ